MDWRVGQRLAKILDVIYGQPLMLDNTAKFFEKVEAWQKKLGHKEGTAKNRKHSNLGCFAPHCIV